jgi:hypothetical protein
MCEIEENKSKALSEIINLLNENFLYASSLRTAIMEVLREYKIYDEEI